MTGRLGRLGTSAADDGEGEGLGQRVVCLVLAGGEEEKALSDMFFGRRSVSDRKSGEGDEDGELARKRTLGKWDLEGLKRSVEGVLGEEEKGEDAAELDRDEGMA